MRIIFVFNLKFEVYTFVMIALNIPASIVSLLNFFFVIQAGTYLNAVVTIPAIFFSVVELLGLTAAPAKVHKAVSFQTFYNSSFDNKLLAF